MMKLDPRSLFLPSLLALAATLLISQNTFAQAFPPAAPAQGQIQQEHPLDPALRIAYDGLKNIERDIQGYTCTFVKRERINGKLLEHEYMFTKIRHKPFSVYMYFLGPDSMKGREVLWVEGQNDGKLRAHEAQGLRSKFGMVSLEPTSLIAMQNQRYPITECGIKVLTQRLIEVGEHDRQFGECEVKFFEGAKINGRVCTCIQAIHPVPRKQFRYHLARIFIDDELQVPIRYEAYRWPKTQGGKPELEEEYTYLNFKKNPGLTDLDFDHTNPDYNFIKKKKRNRRQQAAN